MEDKDRLGAKLEQKERAEENRYFAERDRELIAKLREQEHAQHEETVRELAQNRCPKCGDRLSTRMIHDVEIDECPSCQGMWLDKGEFEDMSKQKGSTWMRQFLDGMSHALSGGKG